MSSNDSVTDAICQHAVVDEHGALIHCQENAARLVSMRVGAEFGSNLPEVQTFPFCGHHAPLYEGRPECVDAIDWDPDEFLVRVAPTEPRPVPRDADIDILRRTKGGRRRWRRSKRAAR